ncbi:universal stress protein [Candidatus Methylomirabilis sp.]|uniref:Universal stress protein n=1 Tax=Candidatus Methylomirabilis tolerans TaxID=3123416 RepID=A0AAJ1AKT7_9BACT|nr:universal stress protein [Candidatus Methylomirabilis sp.]
MMPTYRKLLVVTDLSPIGNTAIPHAYAILAERSGSVILWHAINTDGMPDPLYAQPTPGKTLAEQRTQLRETLFSSLEALIPEEARVEGKVTTEVRVVDTPAPVHEMICQEAITQKADLIVMTSHGYSGMKHMLLGSVAEGVLRLADRPVLVVRSRE